MPKKLSNTFAYQGWSGPADITPIHAMLNDLSKAGKTPSPALQELITSLLTATPAERYAYNMSMIFKLLSKGDVTNFSRDGVTELEHGLLTWLAQQEMPVLHDAFEQLLSLYDRRLFVLQFSGLFRQLREEFSSWKSRIKSSPL